MAWANNESTKTKWTLDELKARESCWLPSPITERQTWEDHYATFPYDFMGEYDIDEDKILLRWKFVGTDEEQDRLQCPQFQNVVLSKKMRPYNPAKVDPKTGMAYGRTNK